MNYKEILAKILTDQIYLKNIEFGEPRPGHAEGKVKHHIEEVLANLGTIEPKLLDGEKDKLLLIVHTHDTFKKDAEHGVPIDHPRSHASLAAAFLGRYCPDESLVAIVQWHDEPFALYRQYMTKGSVNKPRLEKLFRNIADWDLFVAFNIIDNSTEGKDLTSLEWFLYLSVQLGYTRFARSDILGQ